MTQFATLDDLAALGGLPDGADEASPESVRGLRLVELASASILVYLDGYDIDEDAVDAWDEFRKDALASITAEIAVKRLNVSAAPSVDPYATPTGPQTIKLNRWEKQSLRDLIPANADGEMPWVAP